MSEKRKAGVTPAFFLHDKAGERPPGLPERPFDGKGIEYLPFQDACSLSFSSFFIAPPSISLIRFSWFTSLAPGS